MSTPPVAAVAASTTLLLRDSDTGLEVLMVRRHHRTEFAGGMLVFPGGKINATDGDPALGALCLNGENLPPEIRAAKVAGAREAFEETGFLLARDATTRAAIAPSRLAALGQFRDDLDKGRIGMAEFLSRHGLILDLDDLTPFGRWITPEDRPMRFDTWFFLALAPEAQESAHDGTEAVDSQWCNPKHLESKAEALAMGLMLPTWANLRRLARSRSAADAIVAARTTPIVTVLPRLDKNAPGGPVMRIPENAGYDLTDYPPPPLPKP